MDQTFEQQVAELRQAEERAAELRNGFDVVEAWDPYNHKAQNAQEDWLQAHDCVSDGWVAHEGYHGYGHKFLCPKGTAAEFKAAFYPDDEEEED